MHHIRQYLLVQFVRMIKNCYPQTLLEECKYSVKGKTAKRFVTEDLSDSSSHNECM